MNITQVNAGDKYGFLTIVKEIEPVYSSSFKIRRVNCMCDCGKNIDVRLRSLRQGNTKSCGCYSIVVQKENAIKRNTTHNLSKTSEYKTWRSMKHRCFNSNNKHYRHYGGRGITVCERWSESFINFYNDMGPKPTPLHSIDRIDVNGNYEPSNCKWSTASEQQKNKRKYEIYNK